MDPASASVVIAAGGLVLTFFALIYTHWQLSSQIQANKTKIEIMNQQNEILKQELGILQQQHDQDVGKLEIADVICTSYRGDPSFDVVLVNRGRRPVVVVDVVLRTIEGEPINRIIYEPRESLKNFQPITLAESEPFTVTIGAGGQASPDLTKAAYVEAKLSTNEIIQHPIPADIIK